MAVEGLFTFSFGLNHGLKCRTCFPLILMQRNVVRYGSRSSVALNNLEVILKGLFLLFHLVRTSWNSVAECKLIGIDDNHACTAQKMKFSITDFFSKCDHIRSFLINFVKDSPAFVGRLVPVTNLKQKFLVGFLLMVV